MEENIIKIACVGDSITYGLTLDDVDTESYPSVLELMLSRQNDKDGGVHYVVGNFGISGAGLWRHGFYRYTTTQKYRDAVSWGADIIIICLGSNDAVQKIDDSFEKEFIEDYISLVNSFKTYSPDARVFIAKIPPILCNPELEPAVARINGAVAHVAEKCGAVLLDFSRPFLERDDLFSDGVHPNREGARLLASMVFNAPTIQEEFTVENLLKIDCQRIVRDEEIAMIYLNSFWRVMANTLAGTPILDPNDLRVLFRKQKELILLPTLCSCQKDELTDVVSVILTTHIQEGDVIFLTFASSEDDWRLKSLQYEGFCRDIDAKLGHRVKLFFANVNQRAHRPNVSPLQVGVMVLRCGEQPFP